MPAAPVQQARARTVDSWVLVQESWYEKLNRWDEALAAYEKKYAEAKNALVRTEAVLGRAR